MRIGTVSLTSNSPYKNNAKQGGGKQMADYPLPCPTEDEMRKEKEDEGKKKEGKGGKGESNRGIERKAK